MIATMRTGIHHFFHYLRGETVLSIAWLLALLSMFLVSPDKDYFAYIDLHTLGLLFALMAVMAGLKGMGVFRRVAELLLTRTHTSRQLEGVLVFLPFFSSMLVTNDVALITFVPFALETLSLAGQNKRILAVVVMQTIAANLGSMSTPVGNPQNLYLYSYFGLSMGDFFATVLPLTLLSFLLLGLLLLLRRSEPVQVTAGGEAERPVRRGQLLMLLGLFGLCLCVVAKLLPLWLVCGLTFLACLFWDREALRNVDYGLLVTFVGFFIFVGNLGRIPAFSQLFEQLLRGNEVLCSVVASQVISNVPAALLLSGFTENSRALLMGVNLGGLGTLIASMASLISYKFLAQSYPQWKGRYLLWFTLANLLFLAILLAAGMLLPQ